MIYYLSQVWWGPQWGPKGADSETWKDIDLWLTAMSHVYSFCFDVDRDYDPELFETTFSLWAFMVVHGFLTYDISGAPSGSDYVVPMHFVPQISSFSTRIPSVQDLQSQFNSTNNCQKSFIATGIAPQRNAKFSIQ